MSVIEKIKLFWHDSDETNYKAVAGESGKFDLYYSRLLIGTLSYERGEWKFVYSEDFKNQSEIATLVNFPSTDQVYTSSQLWPFFASRLPGAAQVDSTLDNVGIVELLRKYGKHVITNPYILQVPQLEM